MAELDKKAIRSLVELSRIECSEDEQEKLLKDLKSILNYVELLQEINTDRVPPCNHVIEDVINVMRDDIQGETLPREVFLANCPSHIGGLVRVPPILKQN